MEKLKKYAQNNLCQFVTETGEMPYKIPAAAAPDTATFTTAKTPGEIFDKCLQEEAPGVPDPAVYGYERRNARFEMTHFSF